MSESRELRALVPFEIAAVLAIAFAPIPEAVPVSLPLLVVASLSRWVRGRGWGEVAGGGLDRFAIGAVVGLVALGLALIAGTPVVETLSGRGVEWSSYPV
ncbi:MAG: hypothetical protein H0T89_34975, partial [Deltaproteobacteria bacterium]|nr:hypothetical protein [Deltaproteobacteria bacterium]